MKNIMLVVDRRTGIKICGGRYAFNFVERSHLASISKWPIIIGIHGISTENRLAGIPFLIKVLCAVIYTEFCDGQHIAVRIITAREWKCFFRNYSQFSPVFSISFK